MPCPAPARCPSARRTRRRRRETSASTSSSAVTDSGTGMPEEIRRKIFEPFYTDQGHRDRHRPGHGPLHREAARRLHRRGQRRRPEAPSSACGSRCATVPPRAASPVVSSAGAGRLLVVVDEGIDSRDRAPDAEACGYRVLCPARRTSFPRSRRTGPEIAAAVRQRLPARPRRARAHRGHREARPVAKVIATTAPSRRLPKSGRVVAATARASPTVRRSSWIRWAGCCPSRPRGIS